MNCETPPRWGIDEEPTTTSPIGSNIAPWRSLLARVRTDGWIVFWRW